MKRVIYQLIVAMALVGFVNAVWPFDSKKGKKDKKKSKRDKKERQMFDGEGEVMTKQEMQMIIKENEIDDVGETPFMAYMIQDEDGDGVNDVTGQKLNVNQIMNQKMLQELMKKDMFDFMPEDVLQFSLTAEQGSVSFFESFEWEETRRVTAFYQVLYEHDESHIDPNNAMTVMVRDPEKIVQYKQTDSDFGFVDFNSTVEGEYEFTFFNPGGPDKRIYLAVHFHNLLDESIPRYDIDETGTRKQISGTFKLLPEDVLAEEDAEDDAGTADESINLMRRTLSTGATKLASIKEEAKMSMIRQEGHNQDVLDNLNGGMVAMVVELAAFVCILAAQLHYVKKLLDNRLII